LRYQNGVIDADLELEQARLKLAGALGLGGAAELPGEAAENASLGDRRAPDLPSLVTHALAARPDLKAAEKARQHAEVALAGARRDALPDPTLGIAYTHDDFTVSGDNPNTLALTLSLPLPIFDRNQGGIGRARVDVQRTANQAERLSLQIRREVAEAARRSDRARTLLAVYEGGMLERADAALRVAERAYKAGASSLLELLEAQRTYIETRGQYLRTTYDYRQATIDVRHVVGEDNL
jgi:cobalt-zinc-cadmium efflux system outer membrane protein